MNSSTQTLTHAFWDHQPHTMVCSNQQVALKVTSDLLFPCSAEAAAPASVVRAHRTVLSFLLLNVSAASPAAIVKYRIQ